MLHCPQCGSRFTRQSSLNRHTQSKHGQKPHHHQCEECQKVFSRHDVLERHEQSIHRGIPRCQRKLKQQRDDDDIQDSVGSDEVNTSFQSREDSKPQQDFDYNAQHIWSAEAVAQEMVFQGTNTDFDFTTIRGGERFDATRSSQHNQDEISQQAVVFDFNMQVLYAQLFGQELQDFDPGNDVSDWPYYDHSMMSPEAPRPYFLQRSNRPPVPLSVNDCQTQARQNHARR